MNDPFIQTICFVAALVLLFILLFPKRKRKCPHYELGAFIINDNIFLYNLNKEQMAQTVLTTQVPFQVMFENPVDAQGQPTVASGNEVWSSTNESVATVEVNSENTLQATVTLTGEVGEVDLVITDPNTGVTGVASVEVVAPVEPIADFGEPTFTGIQA